MKKRTPVKDIMTSNVIALQTTDDLETAESLFKKNIKVFVLYTISFVELKINYVN